MKETAGNSQRTLAAEKLKRREDPGVIYREIREIREKRVALVRVVRVVRGENASILCCLRPFAANQCKRLSKNHLHSTLSFAGQVQSSLITYIPHLEDVNWVAVSNVARGNCVHHGLISVLLSKGRWPRIGPKVFRFAAASAGSS